MPISWNMHKYLKETGFLTMGAKEHKRYKGQAGVQRYSFAPAFGQRINRDKLKMNTQLKRP